MIGFLFILLAIITLIIGHLVKVYRWNLFINIYEKPNEKNLINSLAAGYLVNAFLPYHLGDLVRAYLSGKKMKNGIYFSLATVIVDRFLDILVVAIAFISLYLLGFKSSIIINSITLYIVLIVFICIFLVFALKHSRFIKIIVKNIASIFNKSIELKILKFTWFIINAFKDIIRKIKKSELFFSTVSMWLMYFLSYTFFAFSLRQYGYESSLVDVFLSLFANGNLQSSTLLMIYNLNDINILTLIYLLVPIIALFVVSLFMKEVKHRNKTKYVNIIPHISENDRLAFLEEYFEGNNREYFNNYLKINSDISIIQDYSAGSNATTMLCTNEDAMFYRKYAFGSAGEKLYEQVEWLNEHKEILPLPEITEIKKGDGYCCYDMPYLKNSIGCFNFVHSSDLKLGWSVLKSVLEDLEKNLYTQNKRKSDREQILNYIDSKVIKNLDIINNTKEVKEFSKYDYLIINGKKYKNFKYFEKYLDKEYLYDIFKNDFYSDIHGDLTIENIICMQDSIEEASYYIIDPNTGNIHDSKNLDYAKLLQSLHGGYEFLMHTKSVEVSENKINYMKSRTTIYDELFTKYKEYLEKTFGIEGARSIFYHEIIHWLRLLPYKINKDRARFPMFYAGFIIVLNEVIDFYEK